MIKNDDKKSNTIFNKNDDLLGDIKTLVGRSNLPEDLIISDSSLSSQYVPLSSYRDIFADMGTGLDSLALTFFWHFGGENWKNHLFF